MQIFQVQVCMCVCVCCVLLGDGVSEKHTGLSSDASFGILHPFASSRSNTTGYYAESTTHCPPRGHIIKENDLKDKSEDHIHRPHYCHRPCLFYLNCLCEKYLTPKPKSPMSMRKSLSSPQSGRLQPPITKRTMVLSMRPIIT